MLSPERVVQRQLEAYNANDIDAWLKTYSPDAEQYELHGQRLTAGHAEIRMRTEPRFSEPSLHAKLLSRVVSGSFVVDHELITRDFPEGKGTVEVLCVYEVANGAIIKASFAYGAKKLLPA